MKLTLKGQVPQILSEIVSFVTKNSESSRYEPLKEKYILEKIKEIDKQKNAKRKQELVDTLAKYSFYDLSLYDREYISDNDLFKLIMIFSHLKGELMEKLTSYSEDRMYEEYGKLERQVSPPLSAYKYIGNNKTDISYSNKSYGLLFE